MPEPRPVDETIRELLVAGKHDQSIDMLRAHRQLSRAIAAGHEAIVSGGFTAWLRLWREGVHSAFVVAPDRQRYYRDLARAGLRLDHHLGGPDIRTIGPTIANGEHLVITETTDVGSGILERGVLLHVASVDCTRTLARLEAPAEGAIEQIHLSDPAWRHLDHAYAEVSQGRAHGRSVAEGLSW